MKSRNISLSVGVAVLFSAGLVGCSGGGTTAPTPGQSRVVALTGTLAFGSVEVGQFADRTLTIANSGTSTLNVTGVITPAGFSSNWVSGTIAAGASQVVVIRFTPTAQQAYGGTLTVNGDQTAGTNTISLSGTGAAPAFTRVIVLSGSLAFGSVPIGQTSDRTLTIGNTGNAVLTITGMTGPGGYTSNWTNGTIPPGLSQAVTIRFTPAAQQGYNGTLTVNGDQTSGSNTVAITGSGSAAVVQPPVINSFTVNPNSITAGGSATLQWNVSGASTVSIDQGIGNVSAVGQTTINPSSSRTYQIVASNNDGNAIRTAFIYVGPSDTCSAAFYPSGTTAVCNNGQLSQSQNRQGTCSQNGGVRCWICPGVLCGG